MNSDINLGAIYIANIMGILLMLIMLLGNTWKLKNSDSESKCIRLMILITMMACIVDPIVFASDGKPGILRYIIVYFGNSYLFVACIITGLLWIKVVSIHTSSHIAKLQKIFIRSLSLLGALFLILNVFIPVVYEVNDQNVYERKTLFLLYIAIDVILMLDGLIIYAVARKKGGAFKFFPAGQFIAPIFIGMLMQSTLYGVSTVWPCMAISITGLLNGLQNETVFQDQLTGLYNRFYLDNMKREIMKKKAGDVTAMMLDLNGFKSINDSFGHSTGDEALIVVASILRDAVGPIGCAIRYAGDEFVLVLNTQQEEAIKTCIAMINEGVNRYNQTAGVSYELSLSIGYCVLDLKKQTIDELMNEVDRRMYDDKDTYYKMNPKKRRVHNA